MALGLSVAIPARLAARPRDPRGLPIPYVVLMVNGVPDFRITDLERWAAAVSQHRCGLCGQPLGAWSAFIGGPKSMASHCFTDSAMHRDCAEFAIKVCPYLALPSMKRTSQRAEHEGVLLTTIEEVVEERPAYFGLGITRQYGVETMPESGALFVRAGPWESLTWYREGQLFAPPLT